MPPGVVVALGVPVTAVLMYWVFGLGNQANPLSYVAYIVSAYAAIIACVFVARGRPAQCVSALARKSERIARLIDDKDYRAVVGVHASLAIDGLWAAANFAMGAVSGSLWFVTLAAYYLLNVLMRAVLVRRIRSRSNQEVARREQRTCLACGVLIVASVLAVSGIVILVMREQGGFSYGGTLIYAVALYAFYALIKGIIKAVTYRTHANPVLFAVMSVNLATALVSVFALEVAMLAAFDTAENELSRTLMLSITGLVVGLLVVAVGMWLIVRSAKALRALSD